MGLTVKQVINQLRVAHSIEPFGTKFKFKLTVSWPLKRFEQTLSGETEFATEEEAIKAAEIAKEVVLAAVRQRYLPGKSKDG